MKLTNAYGKPPAHVAIQVLVLRLAMRVDRNFVLVFCDVCREILDTEVAMSEQELHRSQIGCPAI